MNTRPRPYPIVPDCLSTDPETMDRLNVEWSAILDVFPRWPDEMQRKALRWVLVHTFGTREQFEMDVQFHAQVSYAEKMIDVLLNLAKKEARAESEVKHR